MRRFWPLLIIAFIGGMTLVLSRTTSQQAFISDKTKSSAQRIITLAPSITEIAFAVGLADRIVGVTDYCDYPVETNNLPKVGGLINPNIEAIVALQADLVILLANQDALNNQLEQLGIASLTIENHGLDSIKKSILKIGKYTGKEQQAQLLSYDIEQKIESVQAKVQNHPKPRVLLAMGHSIGDSTMNTVYIAGQNDFYNDLINLAGGQNVYTEKRLKVPTLGAEGILKLNPDIILDVFPEAGDHDYNLEQVKQQWLSLTLLDAVKNNRVHIIEENYATMPGPRIFLLLEQMAQLFHPQLDWQAAP